MQLSYHAFEACLADLLWRIGYTDVRMLGRTSPRQRTRHGGRDLEASSRTGLTRSRIIVQAKQYRRPVQRRFVDELRGVMLRTGAAQGVLITTSRFPVVARQTAHADRSAPVRLVDAKELLDLLIAHGIGVTTGAGDVRIDSDFFADLNRRFPGRRTAVLAARSDARNASASASVPVLEQLLSTSLISKGGDMLARTHVLLGLSALWPMEAIPHVVTGDSIAILATAAVFGALLPDLDAAESKLQQLSIAGVRPFAPFGALAHQAWGHRGFLHSPVALVLLAALLAVPALWWGWTVSLALWLGYASHLIADACTKTGIPGWRAGERFYLLPRRLRISTGSAAEEMLLPILAASVILLFLRHLYNPVM
jgi:membrane-bound metal-dependent hydrolase YbcI (DUF457 family)